MTNWQTYKPKLLVGLAEIGLNVSDLQADALLGYLASLSLWNKKFNLTAITQPEQMLIKHVFDSLSIVPHLPAGHLLDVGTGAGLPGLLVAIVEPERTCTLLDSNSKRIRFLRQVISDLKLTNVTATHSRIEEAVKPEEQGFDVITSRAFASLVDFVTLTTPVLADDGTIVAMKGVLPEAEMAQLAKDESWAINSIEINVPSLPEQRHLVFLKKSKK